MTQTVSVIGLGKLGAPMVSVFASKGYQVVGADTDPAKVQAVASGKPPVVEPGLADLLHSHRDRISATTNIADAVRASEMSFVVVPTPSCEDGTFSLDYTLAACKEIGKGLRDASGFPLVVLTSTVMPGSTDGPVREKLESVSGKKCGVDFGLCYSPEFIALGSVIHDMLNPDFVLIGESDHKSGAMLAAFYLTVCDNTPRVSRMSPANAEITKIAVNTYITTKISYANMLGEICDTVPGADVDVVTAALGLDTRIGGKYLKAATGYGGPCFPRDNVALSAFARSRNVRPLIAEATDAVNDAQASRIANLICSVLPEGGRVGLLGLSYKPGTDVVTESQGVEVARLLAKQGHPVSVYDPLAMANAHNVLGVSVNYAESAEECAGSADVVVVMTAWPDFLQISCEVMARPGNPRFLIDCWRQFAGKYGESVNYVVPGVGK